jgi:hypothetical protein
VRTKKLQISPLRCAPVEMTNLFGNARFRFQDDLSPRPERSGVERSAVSAPWFSALGGLQRNDAACVAKIAEEVIQGRLGAEILKAQEIMAGNLLEKALRQASKRG